MTRSSSLQEIAIHAHVLRSKRGFFAAERLENLVEKFLTLKSCKFMRRTRYSPDSLQTFLLARLSAAHCRSIQHCYHCLYRCHPPPRPIPTLKQLHTRIEAATHTPRSIWVIQGAPFCAHRHLLSHHFLASHSHRNWTASLRPRPTPGRQGLSSTRALIATSWMGADTCPCGGLPRWLPSYSFPRPWRRWISTPCPHGHAGPSQLRRQAALGSLAP